MVLSCSYLRSCMQRSDSLMPAVQLSRLVMLLRDWLFLANIVPKPTDVPRIWHDDNALIELYIVTEGWKAT